MSVRIVAGMLLTSKAVGSGSHERYGLILAMSAKLKTRFTEPIGYLKMNDPRGMVRGRLGPEEHEMRNGVLFVWRMEIWQDGGGRAWMDRRLVRVEGPDCCTVGCFSCFVACWLGGLSMAFI